MDKTQKEKIREIMTDFDIKQRLFLNGKYHSTQFNKWFEQTLKDVADLAIKETEGRIGEKMHEYYVGCERAEEAPFEYKYIYELPTEAIYIGDLIRNK